MKRYGKARKNGPVMDKASRIYIAGHTGLVGSALHRKLTQEGYANIVFRGPDELDLRRQEDVERFFAAEKPEYVFLAAARVGGILANSTYKADFIYDNIAISTNIIRAAYVSGVKKLLNLGTACIYPKFAPQPMREEHLLTGPLEPTNEPYAIAKIAAIKLCRYYNEQYGTNFISVMPINLYGPFDNFNLETAHVIPALIRKFHLAMLLQKGDLAAIRKDLKHCRLGFGLDEKMGAPSDASIEKCLAGLGVTKDSVDVWGSGQASREFLYVDDLAEACVFLMQRYNYSDIGELINIGVGKDMKLKEIVAIVRDVVGFKGAMKYDTSKPDGTPRKLLDVTKIHALGWKAKHSFEEGVKKEYEWYRERQRT